MSDTTIQGSTVTIDGFAFDLSALPAVSVMAMFRRGAGHYLRNEMASKLSSERAKRDKTGVPMTDEEADAFYKAAQADAAQRIASGDLAAIRAKGEGKARLSPLEKLMREIAERRARTLLAKANLALPTGDKTVQFPNGDSFTREQILQRQIDAEAGSKAVAFFGGKTVRAEAEAEVRKLEKASKAVGDGEVNSAEDLGV